MFEKCCQNFTNQFSFCYSHTTDRDIGKLFVSITACQNHCNGWITTDFFVFLVIGVLLSYFDSSHFVYVRPVSNHLANTSRVRKI